MKFRYDIIREVIESICHPFQLSRAIFWRLARRAGLIKESDDSIADQIKDRILPFDEYPSCEMCGRDNVTEKLVTQDGSHIVECNSCGLWFTSPRIKETLWNDYLRSNNERNIEFTENRIRYGVALAANIKYVMPNWRKSKTKMHFQIFDDIEGYLGRKLERIHETGCGAGFLVQDAISRGIEASGNDLNAYACEVMEKRLKLNVYNEILPNLNFAAESIDAIFMLDYIEHTYHPLADLKAAHKFLKNNGIIYIDTFHVDCSQFDKFKGNWKMLFWNHVYHFSQKSLEEMVKIAGFDVVAVHTSYEDILIKIIAKKL